MDENRKVYESKRISSDYFGKRRLFPSEKQFINSIPDKISSFDMLDVGIGGGRTTRSFAPIVAHYTGIDYAGAMIRYCKQKYTDMKNATFMEMDARDLSAFPDNKFDLILFSFNGIDCVDYEGRKKVLLEFNRVMKPGGILLFSFHNVRHLYPLYSFHRLFNPLKILWELRRMKTIRKINGGPEQYAGKEIFSIYDGADHFQTLIFYLLPEKQSEDLKKAGFEVTQWQDLQSNKIIPPDQLVHTTIPWIFVQARKT